MAEQGLDGGSDGMVRREPDAENPLPRWERGETVPAEAAGQPFRVEATIPGWLVRLMAEQAELLVRMRKLQAFCESDEFGALPNEMKGLLLRQMFCMDALAWVLSERVRVATS